MSSSLSLSLSAPFIYDSRHGTKLYPLPHAAATPTPRCFKSFSVKCSLDHIPKQFRQENLQDGLMDNYENVPQSLYGLSPSQMDMFMTEGGPVQRMGERVTEESITSRKSYMDQSGMSSLSGNGSTRHSMSVMARGGRGGGRPSKTPPDLPSLLLDARIVYLGMPIVPAVAELIVAELMWLDYDNPNKPIYLYINSPGTQNNKKEVVGSETDAYSIADMIRYVKSDVYTVNLAMAFGQAAMLLSLGKKGYRALQPHASTKLYLPKSYKSSGVVVDMWIKAKELEVNAEYFIELVAKGTGKSEEEIAKDLQESKHFLAQEAIDYGLADRIILPGEPAYEKRDYKELRAQRLMRQHGGNPQAAPSGF